MSIWVDCEPTAKDIEESLREDIANTKTLEEWCQLSLNERLSKCKNVNEIIDLWRERGESIKRELIAQIKTPEDGFALHLRMKALRIYSTTIQVELADKIRDVVAKWRPESRTGVCVTMF
jgi:hypothetical protein